MDVVYVVRPGDDNEELRFSLRSLAAHMPHDRVWLAGYRPSWVVGCEFIPVEQDSTKYANSTRNLRAACEHPGVSEDFIYFNDDFFVMHEVESVPVLHRGWVTDVLANYLRRFGRSNPYAVGMADTMAVLADNGCRDPLSYELHMPMTINAKAMLAAMEVGRGVDVLHKRTLYGNLAGIGGEIVRDCKVRHSRDAWDPGMPFLSTTKTAFIRDNVGNFIRHRFKQPCRFEGDRDAQ